MGSQMTSTAYKNRVDALDAVWQQWAAIGAELSEQQWSCPTRCPGWDVAALYAHVGMFPPALVHPPDPERITGDPVTAVDILRGFNAVGGEAHEMAVEVANTAVATAGSHARSSLVAIYSEEGPRAIGALRERDPASVVPWPGTEATTTWSEALRIVLMESVVHLLDVLDGLGLFPHLPTPALEETRDLLAEVADPVELIEAASGRSSNSPLPVLR